MHTKNIIAILAITSSVVAAPLPSQQQSPSLNSVVGSALGSLNGNGGLNSAGNGNKGNGNNNGDGSGSNDGNQNVFGNGNSIGSGNTGAKFLKRTPESKSGSGSGILGSLLGSLNGNGVGNAAGNGNVGNGNNNGDGSGSNDGNNNEFGNGNLIGSNNSGSKILQRGGALDIVGSALGSLNSNGNGNKAGNDNSNNGNGNGNDSGSNDGNGNTFGNSNSIGSGNSGLSFPRDKKVRRQSGAAAIVPDQTLTTLNKDASQVLTVVVPSTGPKIITGALTGQNQFQKRQLVLTGVGDVVAQDIAKYIPKE